MCVCRYASQKEALLPPCMLPYVMCSSPTCGLSSPSAHSWSAISSAVGGVSLLLSPSPVCDPPAVARVCMTGVAVAVARGLAIAIACDVVSVLVQCVAMTMGHEGVVAAACALASARRSAPVACGTGWPAACAVLVPAPALTCELTTCG